MTCALWRMLGAVALSLACLGPALGQATSSGKPITLVLPYAAGGPGDAFLRPLAAKLQEVWGRPVLVDSRSGANGAIGTRYVINAPPDGNTILYHITSLIQSLALSKTKAYDPFKDLQPIVLIGRMPAALAVPSSSPYMTLADLAKAVTAAPEKFAYGSYGNGSTSHIYGELLRATLNVDIPHVPFRGMGPLLTEMMGGRIQMAFVPSTTAVERDRDRTLRVLAVAAPRRMEMLPNVPTLEELGYKGFEALGWWGLFMHAGTPRAVSERITADIRKAMRERDMLNRLRDLAIEPSDETPEQIMASMKTEYRYWEALSQRFNIAND